VKVTAAVKEDYSVHSVSLSIGFTHSVRKSMTSVTSPNMNPHADLRSSG
jgi:hypothetical protein